MLRLLNRLFTNSAPNNKTFSSVEDNLKIISDNMNYDISRISRVIRAYYFLYKASKSDKTVWKDDPIILESAKKATPIIKLLEPEDIILLIKNSLFLKINDSEFWNEIEICFERKCYHAMKPEDLSDICLGFSLNKHRNLRLLKDLEARFLQDFYPNNRLKLPDIVNIIELYVETKLGSKIFMKYLFENLLANRDYLRIFSILDVLNLISNPLYYEENVFKELIEIGLNKIDADHDVGYHTFLTKALGVGMPDAFITRLENLVLEKNKENINYGVYSYLLFKYSNVQHEMLEKRMDFVKAIIKQYLVNIEKSALKINEQHRTQAEMLLAYFVIKLKIEFPEDQILKIYKSLKIEELCHSLTQIQTIEDYLKSRNLIS